MLMECTIHVILVTTSDVQITFNVEAVCRWRSLYFTCDMVPEAAVTYISKKKSPFISAANTRTLSIHYSFHCNIIYLISVLSIFIPIFLVN